MHTGFWWGNLRDRDHLEDTAVDGMIILKWIFKKWDGGMDWIDVSEHGQAAGSRECGDEPSTSIKCGEFLDSLRTF